jgi:hypothetical protein
MLEVLSSTQMSMMAIMQSGMGRMGPSMMGPGMGMMQHSMTQPGMMEGPRMMMGYP